MSLPGWRHLHRRTQGMSDCCDLDSVCQCTVSAYFCCILKSFTPHNDKAPLIQSSMQVKTETLHHLQGAVDMTPIKHWRLWSKPFVLAKKPGGIPQADHLKISQVMDTLLAMSRAWFEECINKHHGTQLGCWNWYIVSEYTACVKQATIFDACLHSHLHMRCILSDYKHPLSVICIPISLSYIMGARTRLIIHTSCVYWLRSLHL